MAVSDVSQKYEVIIRIFEILKYQNISALTVWPLVPITFLILNNHQSVRLAAKISDSAEIAFFTFWSNVTKALSASERECERKILLKRRELINNGVDPKSLRNQSLKLFQDNIEVQPTDWLEMLQSDIKLLCFNVRSILAKDRRDALVRALIPVTFMSLP